MSATTGARRAASLHSVYEKNKASADPKKRRFAGEAASSLSFWALGLRPAHRSDLFPVAVTTTTSIMSVTVATSAVLPRQTQGTPATPLSDLALVSAPTTGPSLISPNQAAEISNLAISAPQISPSPVMAPSATLADVQLPVSIRSGDAEFDSMYDAMSPISEVSKSSVAPFDGGRAPVAGQGQPNLMSDAEPTLVIVASDGEDFDHDIVATAPPPSSDPPKVTRRYPGVGQIKKRSATPRGRVSAAGGAMGSSVMQSPLVALFSKSGPTILPSTVTTASSSLTPCKRPLQQLSMSAEEWRQFQEFRKTKSTVSSQRSLRSLKRAAGPGQGSV